MEKISLLKDEVTGIKNLEKDTKELYQLAKTVQKEEDTQLYPEIRKKNNFLIKNFEQIELKILLSGKYDFNNCILAIHAGAGGEEACDWASMLLRMYLRFCENKGYKTRIINQVNAAVGIKSVTLDVIGNSAYGYLAGELGVHRLVRLSPFDATHSRHTSFALVEVMPEVLVEKELEIPSSDLKIETFRASGPGGQGVNTTDSAVRITHIPTGINVSCQNERSQLQNKNTALRILKSKLLNEKIKKEEEERAKIRGEHLLAGWGNQIRSYILHPYNLVKDHRTGQEVKEAKKVLDGALDEFIEAYLRWRK